MSKARLVITAVVAEGLSQGEAARRYGVSQGWISRLVARYRAEGETAFEPRSRRPKTSPAAIRFAAELPNECWQSDFTHWKLAGGLFAPPLLAATAIGAAIGAGAVILPGFRVHGLA
jgi:transposase InsO family protein